MAIEQEPSVNPVTGYRISFADSYPDEPGTGGSDSNFSAEWEFFGTPEDAIRHAKGISYHVYRGDFKWWIEEDPAIEKTQAVEGIEPSLLSDYPLPTEEWQKKQIDIMIQNLNETGSSILSR